MDAQRISVEARLRAVAPEQQLLFGACCVKRMLRCVASYDRLLADCGRVPGCYEHANAFLRRIFGYLEHGSFSSPPENMRIREKIFALIPDTDDLPDDAAVLAQNALIALSYLYDFVLDPNPVYALYCSDKLAESVDLLHYPQGEAASDAALAHEYATQLRCLSLIGAGATPGVLHAFAASHCVPCN